MGTHKSSPISVLLLLIYQHQVWMQMIMLILPQKKKVIIFLNIFSCINVKCKKSWLECFMFCINEKLVHKKYCIFYWKQSLKNIETKSVYVICGNKYLS